MVSSSQSFLYNTQETNMKKMPWILAFLSFLIPLETMAQTQDIHALRIIVQSFEKAKKDNKIRQDTIIANKNHLIENLSVDGKFKSKEKEATYKIYNKKGKSVEELIGDVWPRGAEPPKSLVDFDKLLDAFLSRFYFSVSQDEEEIDEHKHYKVHFWPKEDLPIEKENTDYILNRIAGIVYINKKTYMVRRINASLTREVKVSELFYSFYMDRLDLEINFEERQDLGLLKKLTATARYSYRKFIGTTHRYQTHIISYKYGIK